MSSTTNDQKKPEPQQQQEQPQQEQQQQQSPSTHEASPAAQPETKPEEKKQKYSQEEVISILAAGIQQLQSPPPPLPADASEEASEHFNFAMIDLFDGLEMTPAATQKLLAQVSQNNKDNKKEGELKTLDLQKLQAESKEQADKVPMVRGPAGYFVDEQRKQYVAVSMGHPFLLFASTE
ncbi:AMPKBI domain-containing protein [Balamuthia mandrillaris]